MEESQLSEKELLAVLRLQAIPNVGDISAKKLISRFKSPSAVFEGKKRDLKAIEGIGPQMVEGLVDPSYVEQAEKEFRFIQDKRIRFWYFADAGYPFRLKHCVDGPILLFGRGKMDWQDRRIISVVGTRNITAYGMDACSRFLEEIAPLDPIIVSGFAYGVDIHAQRTAMDLGLQTIGCLAHGLDRIYPAPHAKYTKKVESHGGFLTEFWSGNRPERENFLRRNRIIAGLGEATVVVESGERGGSLVTAGMANGYNREVFAIPGRVSDTFSTGCNNLIKKQAAHMLTSAADLVYQLNWELPDRAPVSVQKAMFVELDETEKLIFEYLQREGKQLLDHIALDCRLPIYQVSSTLLNMEMKGVIRPLPGKIFEII